MPLYRYVAIQSDGRTVKGLVTADTEKLARQKLRASGETPVELSLTSSQASKDTPIWRREIHLRAAFGLTARALLIRQLSSLTEGGLTLERALLALQDDAANPRQREIFAAIHGDVTAGASLSSALANFPTEFPVMDRAVIAAGEQGGQFSEVLTQLANELESAHALRAKLLGAALYPAIVSIVAMLITIFLLGSVVPQVTEVFSQNRYDLPPLTVFVVSLSNWVNAWGGVALAVCVVLGLLSRSLLSSVPRFRLLWDQYWLNVPVLGRFITGYNSARFASTLALLVMAGVPIIKALHTAGQTITNAALKKIVVDAVESVTQGAPLALALESGKRFPRLLLVFIRLGEKTGDLPTMLDRAAKQLNADLQRRAITWATALEPLLIVAMGGVVMVIVLAVLLPIIQLNQWVK